MTSEWTCHVPFERLLAIANLEVDHPRSINSELLTANPPSRNSPILVICCSMLDAAYCALPDITCYRSDH